MNIYKRKLLLNMIIAVATVILIITVFTGWTRIQTTRSYERLAEIKAEQEKNISTEFVADSLDDDFSIGTTLEKSNTSEIKYTYKPNENSKWLSINEDYFGWIRISGTNIDYPYVRSHDNKDYLTLDFDGNYSDAGTVFMDYRNLGNFNDQHTIIYGHYMKNKTMFHNLTKYHQREYFEENQIIELSGLYETKTYKIFSVYEISVDDYAFTLEFEDSKAYQNYLDDLLKQSMHTPNFEIDSNQKLLTLVTCSYGVGNGRTIVHAIEQSD